MTETPEQKAARLGSELHDAYGEIARLEAIAADWERQSIEGECLRAAVARDLADARAELREVHAANEGMGLALTELKKVDLIGPLTAEEWAEFRLRDNEDEDAELLRCCANTSAVRDEVFHIFRSYAADAILGRPAMERVMRGIWEHGDLMSDTHPAGRRLRELVVRMCTYYGVEFRG